MTTPTKQDIAQWANGTTLTRVKDGNTCRETIKEQPGKVFHLEKQSETRFKLIGVSFS